MKHSMAELKKLTQSELRQELYKLETYAQKLSQLENKNVSFYNRDREETNIAIYKINELLTKGVSK